jgi:cbb3-type cytochrome oxidase cytochrome c subunit
MHSYGNNFRRARKFTPCPCGSGRESAWQYDARNIPLCRTCVVCHDRKMRGYRPEVLTNPNYAADEQIEPE